MAITTVLLDLLLKAILPMPVQGSHQAQVIDQLTSWHLTLIAFLFSLVVVIMLYSLFVFRKKDGDESEGAHFEGNTVLEIAWTVIPLIVVFVFGFFGVRALSDVTRRRTKSRSTSPASSGPGSLSIPTAASHRTSWCCPSTERREWT